MFRVRYSILPAAVLLVMSLFWPECRAPSCRSGSIPSRFMQYFNYNMYVSILQEQRQDLRVRLVDSASTNEGRVEVFYNGAWGTVCDNSWDDTDALVVCNELGLGNSGTAIPSAGFGQGTGCIALDNVRCRGSEPSLSLCPSGQLGETDYNCDHSNDAGVRCHEGGRLTRRRRRRRRDADIDPTWPDGTYGLPKPTTGCPNSRLRWTGTGWWQQLTGNGTEWSQPRPHLAGSLYRTSTLLEACVKMHPGSSRPHVMTRWQSGSYCIFRKGDACPLGFNSGSISWDDRDSVIRHDHHGTLPDGLFLYNTTIQFCCREDGLPSQEIVLPTEDNFYLFPRLTDECQAVRGMTATKEWVKWDTTDRSYGNLDHATGSYPYEGPVEGIADIKLYYCYYQRN